ncbi:MAG: hypothetical protein AAF988_06490, partial [Pseudomonadota bacterium]
EKIGILDPLITKSVTITNNLIRAAIRQIEVVGILNEKEKTISIDRSLHNYYLAINSTKSALHAIEAVKPSLESFINYYNDKLSNPSPFFKIK